MTTYYRCGACGALHSDDKTAVILSEVTLARGGEHRCGFLAIRCRAHPNALGLVRQAMRRHLTRVAARPAAD